ncbi:MAG: hypothetical protein MJ063_06865 [Lachnospiraceae bacterium]|nr:hypothetical protein [Lachnospiraceae bacterium]
MKNKMKKFLSLFLTAIMVLTMSAPAFAAEEIAEANEAFAESIGFVEAEAAEAAVAAEGEMEEAEENTAVPEAENGAEADLSIMLGTGSSIGDLWDGWDEFAEDTYRPTGSGTEADPYVISEASQLMWLSVNTTKKTAGVASAYYVLSADIDLTGAGWWHPIGFYKNEAGTADKYSAPFSGHFDGLGHTISGLNINSAKELVLTGLFGYVNDAEIVNLTVESDGILGYSELGILAAKAAGETDIKNVAVSGYVQGHSYLSVTPSIGGIVGAMEGSVVIEDCEAAGVCFSVPDGSICYVGGIAGTAKDGYIVDCTAIANLSTGLTGCGYIGGIAGQQDGTNIYNSYVNGTIGGSGSIAVGGIVGQYKGGEIILAQSFAELGDTQAVTAHEGMIIGDYFSSSTSSVKFGNTKEATAAYWFVTEDDKNLRYIGSGRDDDTAYTTAAHVGCWTNNELKYVLYNGTTPVSCGDTDFYYEELEDGIRFLVTQKLNRKFTIDDYADGLRFQLNHYAPAYNGVPVKGHLVSIPMINSVNSVDTDVATLTAVAGDGSLFYKVMDMNSAAAVEAGTLVTIRSSAKNVPEQNKYFQRVVDETVSPEKEVRPTYSDSTSGSTQLIDMTYQTEGCYTFMMPDCDTELNIKYEKVLSEVLTSPRSTVINIVETRTGDRKNPGISWTIRDENGNTLANAVKAARTEGGPMTDQLLTNDKVTPVSAAALFNSISDDNKVVWSVDDSTLICTDGTESGYTDKAAKIKPEMTVTNTWLATLINQAELAQRSAYYTTKIPATVHTKTAVLTATSDPAHSIDGKVCSAHCEITLNFHIDDQTTLQVEGVSLDKDSLTYTVTRKLTGNRRAPVEAWTVTGSQSLKAAISPAESFVKNVSWEITGDAATSVSKSASGDYDHDLTVTSVFNGTDPLTLPAWMSDLYADDNAKKTADKNYVMANTAAKTGTIKVTAEDKEKGVWTDTCALTVTYVTADETPDVDELTLNTDNLTYTVTRILTGDRKVPTESYNITSSKKLTASLSGNAPFLENVIWSVDSALEPATVRTLSGTFNSTETVSVNFDPADLESAPAWIANAISTDDDRWTRSGKAEKRTAAATVEGYITARSDDVTVPDGTAETAKCKVTVNFVTEDRTVTYGGSSAGSAVSSNSGGVSGGGSSGGSAGARPNAMVQGLPSYVIGGTWREVNSLWSFADTGNVLIQGRWAAVVNPYAAASQPKFDWFAFDPAGNMRVGWFDDTDGNRYYLSPAHDGTYGHMVVGYQYIDGCWYYFNNTSDGTRGALVRNGVTRTVGSNPAGLATDAEGRILNASGSPETDPGTFKNNENTMESLMQAGAGR